MTRGHINNWKTILLREKIWSFFNEFWKSVIKALVFNVRMTQGAQVQKVAWRFYIKIPKNVTLLFTSPSYTDTIIE